MAQMNDEITLKCVLPKTLDADGFPTEEQTYSRNVFAYVKSVRQTEYYEAMRDGIKAQIVFEVYPFEYYVEDGEGNQLSPNKIVYNGKEYKVVRPYQKGASFLELTCAEVE